jgi:hypothetical protein
MQTPPFPVGRVITSKLRSSDVRVLARFPPCQVFAVEQRGETFLSRQQWGEGEQADRNLFHHMGALCYRSNIHGASRRWISRNGGFYHGFDCGFYFLAH